ncbi:MAG: hypothetical protein ACRDKJ_03720 [Actinomycetota bacterium]
MPICPHCNLGIPPAFVVCPDCGRRLVEVATEVLETQVDVVEIQALSEMVVDELPDESDLDPSPRILFEPEEHGADSVAEGVHEVEEKAILAVDEDGEPVFDDEGPVLEPEPEPEPEPTERPVKRRRARRKRTTSARRRRMPKRRPAPVAPEPTPEPDPEPAPWQVEHQVPSANPPLGTEEEPEASGHSVEAEEDTDEDQFVGTTKGFARIQPSDLQPSVYRGPTARAYKRVRWADRAYRGEVEMSSAGSRAAATLVVFGDGLLLIASGGSTGLLGAARGVLSRQSSARKRQKMLSLAGSSAEGQTRVPGSRRLAPSEIESVSINKATVLQRELTIRTSTEEALRYRFPAKRYRQLVRLLAPVLGGKLFDSLNLDKASSRTG